MIGYTALNHGEERHGRHEEATEPLLNEGVMDQTSKHLDVWYVASRLLITTVSYIIYLSLYLLLYGTWYVGGR